MNGAVYRFSKLYLFTSQVTWNWVFIFFFISWQAAWKMCIIVWPVPLELSISVTSDRPVVCVLFASLHSLHLPSRPLSIVLLKLNLFTTSYHVRRWRNVFHSRWLRNFDGNKIPWVSVRVWMNHRIMQFLDSDPQVKVMIQLSKSHFFFFF